MIWSDERVETLRNLWAEGLSASQIAARFEGVSRNAVIGKLHRLGRPARDAQAAEGRPAAARPIVVRPQDRRNFTPPAAEAPGLATFATLKGHMCKWPIGDPAENGFTFCGHASSPGRPYCAHHSYAAYRPTSMASRESLENDVTRLMRRIG